MGLESHLRNPQLGKSVNVMKYEHKISDDLNPTRRDFIQKGLLLVAASSVTAALLTGCADKDEKEGQEVSPPEDLMQEHGLLNRILLIYDTCKLQLINKQKFS